MTAWDAGDPYGLRIYRVVLTWLGVGLIGLAVTRAIIMGAAVWPLLALALVCWGLAWGTEPIVRRLDKRGRTRRGQDRPDKEAF